MNDPDILKLVKEQEDYLIKMRRYFHMNPELSNKEFETRKTIISELEKMCVPPARLGQARRHLALRLRRAGR